MLLWCLFALASISDSLGLLVGHSEVVGRLPGFIAWLCLPGLVYRWARVDGDWRAVAAACVAATGPLVVLQAHNVASHMLFASGVMIFALVFRRWISASTNGWGVVVAGAALAWTGLLAVVAFAAAFVAGWPKRHRLPSGQAVWVAVTLGLLSTPMFVRAVRAVLADARWQRVSEADADGSGALASVGSVFWYGDLVVGVVLGVLAMVAVCALGVASWWRSDRVGDQFAAALVTGTVLLFGVGAMVSSLSVNHLAFLWPWLALAMVRGLAGPAGAVGRVRRLGTAAIVSWFIVSWSIQARELITVGDHERVFVDAGGRVADDTAPVWVQHGPDGRLLAFYVCSDPFRARGTLAVSDVITCPDGHEVWIGSEAPVGPHWRFNSGDPQEGCAQVHTAGDRVLWRCG